MQTETATPFPTVRRINPTERAAILAWADRRPGVLVEMGTADDGHEFAMLGVMLPGDTPEDARWYGLARHGAKVVLHSAGDVLTSGRDLAAVLEAFGRMLPGSTAPA